MSIFRSLVSLLDRRYGFRRDGGGSIVLRSPKWSDLYRIGKSYTVRATILAPFIGSIVIFNQNLSEFLDHSIEFLTISGYSDKRIETYTIDRLYFLYYGLFFVGIGSIIYYLFCPSTISSYGSIDKFNEARKIVDSDIQALRSFTDILDTYVINNELVDYYHKSYHDVFSYNKEIDDLSSALFTKLHKDINWSNLLGNIDEPDSHQEGNIRTAYRRYRGYVDLPPFCRDMFAAPGVIVNTMEEVKSYSVRYKSDIYTLEFLITDISRPLARVACLLLYALGFAILAIPSAETFIRLTLGIIWGT